MTLVALRFVVYGKDWVGHGDGEMVMVMVMVTGAGMGKAEGTGWHKLYTLIRML